MTGLPPQQRHARLLEYRQELTEILANGPLDPRHVIQRAEVYTHLNYPDLAAADAYLALTLAETALDHDFSDLSPEFVLDGETVPWPSEDDKDAARRLKLNAMKILIRCLVALGCLQDAWNFYFQFQIQTAGEAVEDSQHLSAGIADCYRSLNQHDSTFTWSGKLEDIPIASLPNSGFARREIYPWNTYEPDRTSFEHLARINEKLGEVAPHLEVRATVLPDLTNPEPDIQRDDAEGAESKTTIQLGLFADRDLKPGTVILREKSLLTAVRTPDASLCDACAAPLPKLDDQHPPASCPDCFITVFCGEECLELAGRAYHGGSTAQNPIVTEDCQDGPDREHEEEDQVRHNTEDEPDDGHSSAFCGDNFDLLSIGKTSDSSTPSEDLYFLLVTRAIAMSITQSVHPLELPEVKYLWGEFIPVREFAGTNLKPDTIQRPQQLHQSSTLPFSLHHSTVLPLRFLETLSLSVSHSIPTARLLFSFFDTWILQTLLAKFRGVASAKQSTWDAKPEVAAVHWRWCLANHSCAPNVRWEWMSGSQAEEHDRGGKGDEEIEREKGKKGEIVLVVREERVWTDPDGSGKDCQYQGIRKDEEIFSHYCDITLPVTERRAWARGALGGDCICPRCIYEAQLA